MDDIKTRKEAIKKQKEYHKKKGGMNGSR